MATLATGLLASFDRTGLSPVGFLQVVSPTSFLVPPPPRFSQRDRSLSERNLLNFDRIARFFLLNYFLSSHASLVCVHELPIPSLHVGSTASPSSLLATMASRRALGEVPRRRNGAAGPVGHLFCLRSSGWPRASGIPSAVDDALAAVRLLRGRG